MPQAASWSGTPSIKGSTESMRMALLTFSLVGLQFTWGIEMTYGTPYLLQLGLTKSRTSLVWIAGPLSGLIMQPIVGVIADRSRSKWGRRRPFMVGGSIIVGACLLLLGWAEEVVGIFVTEPQVKAKVTIAVAVLSIYAVDFSINAGIPIVLPKSYRGHATYIEATIGLSMGMVAVGSLVGYGAGSLDLVKLFGPAFGDTQFKQLTAIAAAAILIAVGVTCYSVQERVLISARDSDMKSGATKMITEIVRKTLHLPTRIRAICWIQFWSWIGWFPFLFYGTTWVGETYFRYDAPEHVREHKDTLGQIGRVGSLALIIFSVVTLSGSLVLPWIVKAPDDEKKPCFTQRPPASIAPMLKVAREMRPDLATAWAFSHLVFAGTMALAPFVKSLRFATTLVSICGISWAITSWAPFAFIGVEINRLSADPSSPSARRTSTANGSIASYHRLTPSLDSIELDPLHPPTTLHLARSSDDRDAEPPSSTGELAGIYLGILNLFTTLPQFVGTFISMAVFSLLEPGKSPELAKGAPEDEVHGTDGVSAIAVCLAIGAAAAVVAAWESRRFRATVREEE